jgi:ketosteroid isomerase-like protein
MNKDPIQASLDHIAKALSEGDLSGVSEHWAFPALMLTDEDATPFKTKSEVEALFKKATEWYHQQGLTATKAELEHVEHLSNNLVAVDVRWPSLDSSGTERASERSHYIMQLGADHKARIRVALTRTK